MSRHWRPDEKVVPLRPGGATGRGRRDWSRAGSYEAPRPRRAATGPSGAVVGVVLVAAACLGISVGLYQVAGPRDAFAASASAGTQPYFGFCKWGGGTNCVVDGDTFYLRGDKVRIAGIDAPETHPPRCAYEAQLGEAATEKLRALLNSGAVTLTPLGTSIERDRDVYGRLLRDVQVDGADVGAAMVGAGVAREYAGGRRPWC